MRLLTIGAFATAAGLTPKALRLYDELDLLPPAAVDPESGYRLYDPAQLDRARLIARLRRIGMPLARIRTVCGLEPAKAADAVDGYWRQVTADTATRGRLAAVLVDDLTGRDTTVNETIAVRHASRCVTGTVRTSNEDAAYADEWLLAVADGIGGPGGAAASAAAIDALRALPHADLPAGGLLASLADAVDEVDRAVRATAAGEHQPGTTLTALLRRGCRLALVHVGDSRAYLLRGGGLVQLTQDHTWVRAQVEQGRMTHEQAAAHPERALLVRALGAGGHQVEADLALRTALVGDRYLVCTDGLSAVLGRPELHAALAASPDPDDTVDRLLELVHAHGAPDNVACVVADVVTA